MTVIIALVGTMKKNMSTAELEVIYALLLREWGRGEGKRIRLPLLQNSGG